MSKYRLGHGKVVGALCKKCGRYYYCDEHYHKGTCDICNSMMRKRGMRNAETKTGQNIRHKGKRKEAH